MGETVDAVVVGAGHNGLVAATMLADAGWSVAVLEATASPGGAVASAELAAPGFVSDVCSAFYPLAVAGSPLADLNLTDFGLTWRHAPHVLAHVRPDGRAAILDRDADVTAASVDSFAAGDGERWRRAVSEWDRLGDALLDVIFRPFPPVRAGARLARIEGVGGLLRFGRRLMLPVRRLGMELFAGDGARLLLAGAALHTDLGPDDAGSGVYGWLLAMVAQRYGFPVPAGGAGQLTAALLRRFDRAGGQVVCGAPVARVVVKAGRAVGVVTADGRTWQARRAILADVHAGRLYRDLLAPGDLPPVLRDDLDHFATENASLKVDWALSGPIPWRDPAVGRAGTVHLDADVEGLSRYAADLANGHRPARPFLLLGQMTTADPSRSPAGTESVWAYTHLPYRGPAGWPADEIAAHVDAMERVIEDHAPGFLARVTGRHVLDPAALEAHDPSLLGGTIAGGSSAVYQQLVFRPVPGLGRADTVVDRLYLASSSAHPGGGVHGGPGANAARAALAREGRLTGPIYHAAVRAAHRAVYRRGG